jgi:hypothetical protein
MHAARRARTPRAERAMKSVANKECTALRVASVAAPSCCAAMPGTRRGCVSSSCVPRALPQAAVGLHRRCRHQGTARKATGGTDPLLWEP